MITLKHFNIKQLQSTNGFNRKINKVATTSGFFPVIYSEIVNVETSFIDVLIIDNKMYFHKVRFYTDVAVKMLNTEFQKIIASLELSPEEAIKVSEVSENFNLIDEIESILSRSMELLNVENTFELDKLEHISSSNFNVTLENFTYSELQKVLEPLVRSFTPNLYSFKIINLSNISVEIVAITTECKIFQYTINFDSSYTRFINRYISSIIPEDQFKELRKNLKCYNFSKALSETISKDWDISLFLTFLLSKYYTKQEEKGFGGEGLKNVYNFFLETSIDEKTAKDSIRHYFLNIATYEQKKKKK